MVRYRSGTLSDAISDGEMLQFAAKHRCSISTRMFVGGILIPRGDLFFLYPVDTSKCVTPLWLLLFFGSKRTVKNYHLKGGADVLELTSRY